MILLDTNALIALAEGRKLRDDSRERIAVAYHAAMLHVSATAAWEVGLLATKTGHSAAIFAGDARRWFERAVARFDLIVVPFDAAMALEAAYLPGKYPNDPADRWTIAVARVRAIPLVTVNRAILAYAALGYLDAIRL